MRITRNCGTFSAHLVPADPISDALAKPTLRAESILDGIFSELVLIVEADGDRLVYNTVIETLSAELRLDVHLAAIGGSGGIADACGLYRKLRIPVGVIADLDVIADIDRLTRIVRSMLENDIGNDLIHRARSLAEDLRKLPPTIEEAEFKDRLAHINQMSTNWCGGDDIVIRRNLSGLATDLDRMRRLKKGGVSNFPTDISKRLCELIEGLKRHGVFLVPVGELEGWLAGENIQASRTNKWAWANEAALLIQQKGPQTGDIWDFVREVGGHLSQD